MLTCFKKTKTEAHIIKLMLINFFQPNSITTKTISNHCANKLKQ